MLSILQDCKDLRGVFLDLKRSLKETKRNGYSHLSALIFQNQKIASANISANLFQNQKIASANISANLFQILKKNLENHQNQSNPG